MQHSRSNSDILVILSNAFSESVRLVYQAELAEPDMLERPPVQNSEIYKHLRDQWPIIKLYSESFPLGHHLAPLLSTELFAPKNKNDTVDMVAGSLEVLRKPSEKVRDERLESAKFVLALLSSAYDQLGLR